MRVFVTVTLGAAVLTANAAAIVTLARMWPGLTPAIVLTGILAGSGTALAVAVAVAILGSGPRRGTTCRSDPSLRRGPAK